MLSAPRLVAFALFAALALAATGCNSNAKKLVGKWKVTAIGDDTKAKMEGLDFILEFKSDGTGAASIVTTDPKAQEFVQKLNENAPTFKWTVNGDKVEITSTPKDGKAEGLFGGKKEKGTATMKFEGDNLTLTPDEAGEKPVKLTRVK